MGAKAGLKKIGGFSANQEIFLECYSQSRHSRMILSGIQLVIF